MSPDRGTEDVDQFGHPQGVQVKTFDPDSEFTLDLRPMGTLAAVFCLRADRKNCGHFTVDLQ